MLENMFKYFVIMNLTFPLIVIIMYKSKLDLLHYFKKESCVDCRRYTDCWSTGWGSEIFPDANIPTFYSDALRLVHHSFISKSLRVLVFFKV